MVQRDSDAGALLRCGGGAGLERLQKHPPPVPSLPRAKQIHQTSFVVFSHLMLADAQVTRLGQACATCAGGATEPGKLKKASYSPSLEI